ncbi:glycosyltransferase family 4 protein [Rosistilla oblonga]|uniref:glycosyltransferase family 4 protein n=1 Tax=Rosistilla oblonga TaxID=2527990 RepID=UPI003A986D1E
MHILFLTPNFPPEVNAGATRQYEHCRRWVAAGHRVTVVAPAPNWPAGKVYPGYRNKLRSVEMIDGIRVVRIATYISANQGVLLRTLSFISYMLHAAFTACFTRNVDVLVSTSPQFFAGFAGTLTRLFRRIPFVLEIRDIWPESVMAVGAMRRSKLIGFLEWLERRMYASADHIVAVGEGYRDKLIERGVQKKDISVVTNGVDLDYWQPCDADTQLRRQWGGEGKFVCAYVGTVGMAHGLDVVLDAAEIQQREGRDDTTFWIVGDGARRQELREDAERRGLRNVQFLGQVTKPEVKQILASSDACLVHLRGTELFGTVIPSKIFETMAMNTPIVMGVRGAAQQVVLDANAGVPMVPDDPASLLQCIDQIAAFPAAFAKGRNHVMRFFDRDVLAQDMLNVLATYATPDKASIPIPTLPATSDADRKAA